MDLIDNSIIFYLVNNNPIHIRRLFKSLDLLQKNYLNKFSYPVVFGHEALPQHIIDEIRSKINTKTYFLDITFKLPDYSNQILCQIPEKFKGHWDENAFFSMGYRHMCRFFAGDIFNYNFFDNVNYFMRMDCDSYFIENIEDDLFRTMQEGEYLYGTTGIDRDMGYVIEGLPEFCKDYFGRDYNNDTVYNGMYKTHFELLDFKWFKVSRYKKLFDAIDQTGNIFIKRWGDAPIRYQGLSSLLVDKKILTLNIPYKHGGDL